jgi:hypothetical protein
MNKIGRNFLLQANHTQRIVLKEHKECYWRIKRTSTNLKQGGMNTDKVRHWCATTINETVLYEHLVEGHQYRGLRAIT